MTAISPSPVGAALAELGIPHEVFIHPGPLKSLEQAAEERGQRPGQVVRSILFRVLQGEYVMVLMAGPGQIDWKKLRQTLGVNRLTMASNEEVLQVTGYPTGAVAPFGIPYPLKTLVDRSVLGEEIVSLGSGIRGTAVILKSKDLLQALRNYELGDFG
jgi:Cys-tRNA(Pro)/Cys-tRNA(Cys) deacylase